MPKTAFQFAEKLRDLLASELEGVVVNLDVDSEVNIDLSVNIEDGEYFILVRFRLGAPLPEVKAYMLSSTMCGLRQRLPSDHSYASKNIRPRNGAIVEFAASMKNPVEDVEHIFHKSTDWAGRIGQAVAFCKSEYERLIGIYVCWAMVRSVNLSPES